MTFTPIVGTLVYLWDRRADEVLMIHRNARTDDDHYGKFNGLGGKVELDEDVVTSARRELAEEAAVDVDQLVLRGTVTWSGFGPAGEDWLGFIFLAEAWTGEPLRANHEGELEWVARSRLMAACDDDAGVRDAAALPLWAGDRHFLPLVFDDDRRAFHGTMPYDHDTPLSWSFVRI
ncbi:MAG: NUDIX hydrolase [Acidimicrobiales bacterium]